MEFAVWEFAVLEFWSLEFWSLEFGSLWVCCADLGVVCLVNSVSERYINLPKRVLTQLA